MQSPTINPAQDGAVTGEVLALMRLEGVVLLAASTLFYAVSDGSWLLYAVLFFAPDLGMIGYLAGPRAGALVYNAAHSIIGPLLIAVAGVVLLWPLGGVLSLIWFSHIGFDRALGYGLKYGTGFGFTHLGRIGRQA
ncbi:DUF4260 domain-containing protein [Rhodopseudomonas sp. B29]|uniref:DUF4260 domain-containing protein n=1 Tax=Rhodopseudomonas sp. B29 TaxID=95607 RepID=UPI000346C906|nr:DUF4260 domain-containing protein [Rhodopseudomonas sp. B29]